MKEVRTTCAYCGVGCGVIASTDGERVLAVRGDPEHPANYGRLCTKGSTLHRTTGAAGRLLYPELREAGGGGGGERRRVGWDEALELAAERFAAIIREHGADAVAFYGSGQLLTEDYYVLNKLARAVVGTNNIDTNSRLCMSSAVAGYKASLGSDSVPACYSDIESADLFFIAGSNATWTHPVLMRRVEAARAARPGTRVVVVDPRCTETARLADLHLPLQPGTDIALMQAMMHWLIAEGRVDHRYIDAHTEGFDGLCEAVRDMTPGRAATICGLPEEDILKAARWWSEAGSVLSMYCQGLNQSVIGTDKNAVLVSLHLCTGQIGRPGAGPMSLTGQPNAMGGREVGALSNLLPGHRELADPQHRAEVAKAWGIEAVPARPGRSAVELFEAIGRGEIQAVWIVCTNPAASLPDLTAVRSALDAARFVVVQEAFASSETLDFADLALPASAWGEKYGTVTNSERRISRVRALVPPPGQARHDWKILCDFARRLERRLHPGRPSGFGFDSPEAIWLEHRSLTVGRDLDISGLSWSLLEVQGPQQWPFPAGSTSGRARLFEDGRFETPSGRARLSAARHRGVAEQIDDCYPLALNTGRSRDAWHTMTRSARLPVLFSDCESPVLSVNPADLSRFGIADGAPVFIQSRRGRFVALAQASPDQPCGQVFLPMHWGSAFVGGRVVPDGANALVSPDRDPISRQPEFKHAAVRIEALPARWQLLVMSCAEPGELDVLRRRWLAHAGQLDAAWAIPIGDRRDAVLLQGFAAEAPPAEWLRQMDALAGLTDGAVLRYEDAGLARARAVRVEGERVVAVRQSGPSAADGSTAWLREALIGDRSMAALMRWLLAPRPPRGEPVAADSVVCICAGVREAPILASLRALAGPTEERLVALGRELGCGRQCGGCVPRLRELAEGVQRSAASSSPSLASSPSPSSSSSSSSSSSTLSAQLS